MNILTFDIEEWFHILDDVSTKTETEWIQYDNRFHQDIDRILELLERKKQKATFICLGWIARRYPEIVKKIDSLGYEIGSHSDMHQLAYELSKDEFKKDLDSSIKVIEDITGKKVTAYRAPGFSIKENNKWVFEMLVERGIEVDCSIFPAKRDLGGFDNFGDAEPAILNINGVTIKEFPINLFKFGNRQFKFSGGGYFRFLPYWSIKKFINSSDYVMTYFHPRDLSPDLPMIKNLSLINKFKVYYGLKNALDKLERLISDFEFVDLRTANKEINWGKVKVVNL